MNDPVNHPAHYTRGGIECLDAIEAALTPQQFVGYLRGNILKYIWRCQDKNGIQDVMKAEFYLYRLSECDIEKERSYLFPAIETEGLLFTDQICKIREEVVEATEAMVDYMSCTRLPGKSRLDVVMKTMDVIHACETLLRMLDISDDEYESIRSEVEKKNRERGYYGDES